jgi:hypothetical protein
MGTVSTRVEVVLMMDYRVPLHRPPVSQRDNARFVSMLPTIRRQVRFAFRGLPAAVRADSVDEALSQAFMLFADLVRRSRVGLAYPTPLARYAVQRVRSGRPLGSPQNARDILSHSAQRRARRRSHGLDASPTPRREILCDLLLATRSITPADLAALRIDFLAWTAGLSERHRSLALSLAMGESTCVVAARFGVSSGRISQIRDELAASWYRFQGETLPNGDEPNRGTHRLEHAAPAY